MNLSDEAYLNAYQRLRELPESMKAEILAEWEMFSRFGEAADYVWANEWLKVLNRVRARYQPKSALMVGDIWYFANITDGLHRSEEEAQLCPYTCEEHRVPKGIPY